MDYKIKWIHLDTPKRIWEEEIKVRKGDDPEKMGEKIVAGYNALETQKYGDKGRLRKLISVTPM